MNNVKENIEIDFIGFMRKNNTQEVHYSFDTENVESLRIHLLVDNNEVRQFILPMETLNQLNALKDEDLIVKYLDLPNQEACKWVHKKGELVKAGCSDNRGDSNYVKFKYCPYCGKPIEIEE